MIDEHCHHCGKEIDIVKDKKSVFSEDGEQAFCSMSCYYDEVKYYESKVILRGAV